MSSFELTQNERCFIVQLAKELYPGEYQPTLTHSFVTLLHHKGLLLRAYTQNIDGESFVFTFAPATQELHLACRARAPRWSA